MGNLDEHLGQRGSLKILRRRCGRAAVLTRSVYSGIWLNFPAPHHFEVVINEAERCRESNEARCTELLEVIPLLWNSTQSEDQDSFNLFLDERHWVDRVRAFRREKNDLED